MEWENKEKKTDSRQEMNPRMEAPASKPDDTRSILRSHMVESKNRPLKVIL